MKSKDLAALVRPHFEANKPFVVHGLDEALSDLTRLPFLESMSTLLKLWPHSVMAHLPKIADEADSIEVSTAVAEKLFNNGMGLLFENAHRISSELTSWLTAIRAELKLSKLTESRCLLYATPQGKGTATHFDQNVNLVLQVHGTKHWWLAENTSVENPLSRHTLGFPIDGELSNYLAAPMPSAMPANAKMITLKPGSLLFVPRGTWHRTEAVSDALSLNFTYSAPTWLDLLSAALRGRLAQSKEWRETALVGDSEKFDTLLAHLALDVPNWNASDILSVTEDNH